MNIEILRIHCDYVTATIFYLNVTGCFLFFLFLECVPDSETGQQSSPHIQLELMRWQPQQGNADRVLVVNINFDTTSHSDQSFRSTVYNYRVQVHN